MQIRNALALATLLLLGYYLLSYSGILRNGAPFTPEQAVRSKLLEWAHRREAPEIAIVGTSRAFLLRTDLFDVPAENLAIYGETAHAGLEILRRSPVTPHIVLVEADSISLARKYIQNRLSEPKNILEEVQWHFSDCRRRPINVLAAYYPQEAINIRFTDRDREIARRQFLDGTGSYFLNELKDEPRRSGCIAEAKRSIDELIERGAKVVFFTIPSDSTVQELVRPYDQIIKQTFSSSKYLWLDSSSESFEMGDLLHLSQGGARAFTRSLQSRLVQSGALPIQLSKRESTHKLER